VIDALPRRHRVAARGRRTITTATSIFSWRCRGPDRVLSKRRIKTITTVCAGERRLSRYARRQARGPAVCERPADHWDGAGGLDTSVGVRLPAYAAPAFADLWGPAWISSPAERAVDFCTGARITPSS